MSTPTDRRDAEYAAMRLPLLYARGIDRRDWALVRSCFADDAFVDGSRAAPLIDAYLEQLRPGVEFFPVTMQLPWATSSPTWTTPPGTCTSRPTRWPTTSRPNRPAPSTSRTWSSASATTTTSPGRAAGRDRAACRLRGPAPRPVPALA
ncbi:hypothetical protein ACU686_08105 [Yinghuangia aomiensis]